MAICFDCKTDLTGKASYFNYSEERCSTCHVKKFPAVVPIECTKCKKELKLGSDDEMAIFYRVKDPYCVACYRELYMPKVTDVWVDEAHAVTVCCRCDKDFKGVVNYNKAGEGFCTPCRAEIDAQEEAKKSVANTVACTGCKTDLTSKGFHILFGKHYCSDCRVKVLGLNGFSTFVRPGLPAPAKEMLGIPVEVVNCACGTEISKETWHWFENQVCCEECYLKLIGTRATKKSCICDDPRFYQSENCEVHGEQYKRDLADAKKFLSHDAVNHPAHYTTGMIEVISFIEDKGLAYHLGNVVKYICRAPHKGTEEQDLRKAQWYLNRYIDMTFDKEKEDEN